MSLRRTANIGKRERAARKRPRRVWRVEKENMTVLANHAYFLRYPEAAAVPLRLGHKHYRHWLKRSLAVADS